MLTIRLFGALAGAASLTASMCLAVAAQAQAAPDVAALPGSPPRDPVPPEQIAPPLTPQQNGIVRPPAGIDPNIQKPVPDPTIDRKSVIVPPPTAGTDQNSGANK